MWTDDKHFYFFCKSKWNTAAWLSRKAWHAWHPHTHKHTYFLTVSYVKIVLHSGRVEPFVRQWSVVGVISAHSYSAPVVGAQPTIFGSIAPNSGHREYWRTSPMLLLLWHGKHRLLFFNFIMFLFVQCDRLQAHLWTSYTKKRPLILI